MKHAVLIGIIAATVVLIVFLGLYLLLMSVAPGDTSYDKITQTDDFNICENLGDYYSCGMVQTDIEMKDIQACEEGYIYYISPKDKKLKRMNDDLTNEITVLDESIAHFLLNDKKIYYTIEDNETLYVFDLAKQETTELFTSRFNAIRFTQNYIYYLNDTTLYRSNTLGEHAIVIAENVFDFYVYGETIFFTKWYEENNRGYKLIYAINKNAEKESLLIDIDVEKVVIHDKDIYFVRESDRKLYRLDLVSKETECLDSSVDGCTINIIDNKLFYLRRDDTYSYIMYDLRTEKQKVIEEGIFIIHPICVVNDTLFNKISNKDIKAYDLNNGEGYMIMDNKNKNVRGIESVNNYIVLTIDDKLVFYSLDSKQLNIAN